MKTNFFSILTVSLALLTGLTACSKENDEKNELNKIVTIRYEIIPADPADKDLKVKGIYTVMSLDYSRNTVYSLDGEKLKEFKKTGDFDLSSLFKVPTGSVSIPWEKEVKVKKGAGTRFSINSASRPVKNIIMRIYMDGKLIRINDDPDAPHTIDCEFRDY